MKEMENLLLDLLFKTEETDEKLYSLVINSGFSILELFESLKALNIITRGERETIIAVLERVSNYARKLKIEEPDENLESDSSYSEPLNEKVNEYEQAKEIVTLRIENFLMSQKRFLKKYDISEDKFNNLLLLTKASMPDLYDEYEDFTNRKKDFNVNRLKHITNLIKTDIPLEDGNKRPVELLDYYMCTDLDSDIAVKIAKTISDVSYINLSSFFKTKISRVYIETSEEELIKMTIKYESTDGSIIEVNETEKKETIEFLINNNIPLYENLYMHAIRRYRKGNLLTLKSELGLDSIDEKDIKIRRRIK